MFLILTYIVINNEEKTKMRCQMEPFNTPFIRIENRHRQTRRMHLCSMDWSEIKLPSFWRKKRRSSLRITEDNTHRLSGDPPPLDRTLSVGISI